MNLEMIYEAVLNGDAAAAKAETQAAVAAGISAMDGFLENSCPSLMPMLQPG